MKRSEKKLKELKRLQEQFIIDIGKFAFDKEINQTIKIYDSEEEKEYVFKPKKKLHVHN